MTKSELVERVLKGEPLLAVEYRSSKAERISYRDKETKTAQVLVLLSHTVENATGSIRVSERVEDTFDPDKYVAPYEKGARVVLVLQSLQVARGITTASGKLELLNDLAPGSGSARPQSPVVK